MFQGVVAGQKTGDDGSELGEGTDGRHNTYVWLDVSDRCPFHLTLSFCSSHIEQDLELLVLGWAREQPVLSNAPSLFPNPNRGTP